MDGVDHWVALLGNMIAMCECLGAIWFCSRLVGNFDMEHASCIVMNVELLIHTISMFLVHSGRLDLARILISSTQKVALSQLGGNNDVDPYVPIVYVDGEAT